MNPFRTFSSKLIPIDAINIDTDQIIPKQFLKLVQKTGYEKFLFYDWRFDKNGNPKKDFVLNNPNYRDRSILLVRENFGSGSSREHAVWALRDFGIRAVIAPSFADIFYNNCFKNGVLPTTINHDKIEYLFNHAETIQIKIDLAAQRIEFDSNRIHFEISESNKKMLIEGIDEIGMTLKFESYISNYEKTKATYSLNVV
ncbi:MAG TPA: 3-isopropylmalate dehydratase small subunit [Nitrososphaeraceae archaeon]|jgi:3-isopropylmalate/(R)-2-methylmalate dehydratase small subunit